MSLVVDDERGLLSTFDGGGRRDKNSLRPFGARLDVGRWPRRFGNARHKACKFFDLRPALLVRCATTVNVWERD